MSAPGQEFREAEYIGLGYLAVTSSELLDRLLAGQQIDDDEKYTLTRAQGFLRDVSSGAKLVTSGVQGNASAIDTVQKLAYSVEPLKMMQEQFRSADVGEKLEKVAESIQTELVTSGSADKSDLELAKMFFQGLHSFLATLVDSSKRRTGVELGFESSLLAHA